VYSNAEVRELGFISVCNKSMSVHITYLMNDCTLWFYWPIITGKKVYL